MPRAIDPFQPQQIRRLVREFGSPLLIVDCARVRAQYRKLRQALPGVDLHYALKPLPHAAVVRTIVEQGGWLDLATTGEVQLMQALDVDPKRCIHTHPIKRPRDIRNALEFGVRTFVADNADEVRKFKPYGERAALLLRVSFRNPGAVCDLSRKFGCDPEDALALARLAASIGVDVLGFSFHVGSQAADALKHVEAIEACTQLLATARRARLGTLDTLDIGGGFPIDYLQHAVDIRPFCAPIRAALARLPKRVRVIAEPGRYIAGPAAIGVATVMGRARREGHWWYYLDDGLYGSYSGQLYDHARYPVEALRQGEPQLPSVLAGPTCDSIDVIAENLMLPQLKAGDLIVGRAMGAYTWASASEFNFFPKATVVAVNRQPGDTGGVE
ncbi:MAG TPA: type III PLP-dependent enzyme [Steroidobacteraceae bacterium]|jgi:ornithine decarboxylase|nr:type III PLP-dependent enzyme [Steroidobacteraceae bacterium]